MATEKPMMTLLRERDKRIKHLEDRIKKIKAILNEETLHPIYKLEMIEEIFPEGDGE